MFLNSLRRISCAVVYATVAISSVTASTSAFASTYSVNPDTLRTALYTGDVAVFEQLNSLYQAKEQVTGARANLLPSLGINATVGGHPSFAVSAISILLPFLLPSNWHQLDATKHQLTANGYAYQLALLNEYASALSIYTQIQGDMSLREVYVAQRDALQGVATTVADEVAAGIALPTDLNQATAEEKLAETRVSNLDELIVQEKAALQKMMGLSISKTLSIAPYHFGELDAESRGISRVLADATDASPELDQVDSLIEAAKQAKYATEWSFLSGASLAVSTDFGGNSFGHLSGGAGVNVGFGLVSQVHLSSLNVAQMQLRRKEILNDLQQTVSSAMGSVAAAKSTVNSAQASRDEYQRSLAGELAKLKLGQATLVEVFQVTDRATQAGVAYAQAVTDLDLQRINLNRTLISNQFAKVPTCHITKVKGGGIGGFFKSIFGHKKARYQSIDEMCRPSEQAASAARGDQT